MPTFKLSSIPTIKLPFVGVSTNPFDLLLAGLALRMMQLAKTNPKFVEMIEGRDFVIELSSADGVARQFKIANKNVSSTSDCKNEKADLRIQFADSEFAVQTLLKADPTSFMTGMQNGTINIDGDFSLIVWFTQAAKLLQPKIPKPVMEKIKTVKHKLSK